MRLQSQLAGASLLCLLIGILLIISPAILGFHADDARWNPVVFGAIAAFLALVRLLAGGYRTSALAWLNALVGAWVFISGFWLASSGIARWDLWIFGALLFIFAISSASATEEWRRSVAARRAERAGRRHAQDATDAPPEL